MSRLQDKYIKEVTPGLRKEFGYANPHQVPAVTKVVLNSGVGRATGDSKYLESATTNLRRIAGQSPVATVSRKSIAGFKLREGQKIGASVTLRGERMYEFLDRLISVALPRVRDFRGINPDAFDPQGNYSLGLVDASIFPEVPFEDANFGQGLQINIVTSAKTADEGRRLLQLMGLPLKRKSQ